MADDLSLDDELLMLAAGGSPPEEGEASDGGDDEGSLRSQSRSPSHSRSPSRSPAHQSRSPSRTPRSASPPEQRGSKQPSPERNMSRSRTADGRKRDGSAEEGEASDGGGSPHSLGSDAMDESDSDDGSDAGDKTHIAGETAFERERRLAEQAEREEERQKAAKIKALVSERARQDSRSSKRKLSDVTDEDDYDARTSRRTRKEPESARRPVRRQRKYSSSNSPEAEKVKKDDGRQPGTLQEYNRDRVGRSNFPEVCWNPGFEDTFVGAFARVCHAQDPVTGQNVYRMCQIKGFTTGKPYKLEDKSGRQIMHDAYVLASYGTVDKEYPFIACSDTKFSEDEFHRRVQMLESQGLQPSTSAFLFKKCSAINDFLRRPMTGAEITEKINRRNRLVHLLGPGPSSAVGPKTLERNLALHKRNEANRKYNEETIRNAQLAQQKEQSMRRRKAAMERKKEEERLARIAANGGIDVEAVKEEEPEPVKVISKYVPKDYSGQKSLTEFSRLRTDDEVIASMDLGIDIEI